MPSRQGWRYRVLAMPSRMLPMGNRLFPIAVAFLGGILVNTMAAPDATDLTASVAQLFDVGERPMAAWIAWCALLVIGGTGVLRVWARASE